MSSAGPGRREVAHRLFAAEYDDATLEYAESDEERAPNYVVTPSGTRINRLFVVGVLTAVEQVNEDTVRARIADPTGAFVVYAGQYQPDELAALQSLEAPAFVAVTGKANTFSPEGSDRVLTSVRPESVTTVDAETRDRWVTTTAEHTLARIQTAASALQKDERGEALRAALLRDGVDPGLAEGVARAIDHYDTTADYLGALRDLAVQSLEVVAGERSEVEALDTDPAGGDGTSTASDLVALLGDDRLAATRASEDVDVEALLGDVEDAPAATDAAADGAKAADQSAASDSTDTDDEDADDVADEVEEGAAGQETAESEPTDAEESDDTDTGADDAAVEEASSETDEAPTESDEAPSDTGDAATDTDDTRTDTDDAANDTGDEDLETDDSGTAERASDAEQSGGDEIYEFDEEEREQIEAEHGVEFQSGTEVDPAGEAEIETEDTSPAADEGDDAGDAADQEAPTETSDDETDNETDDAEESDDAEKDVDLEAVLVEEMSALDDGDGADREALIDAVAGETGADTDAIDDAIDDLLMSGQCYEPSEGTLKPI